MTDKRVLALVGSLRAGSFNRQLAEHVRDNAPAGVTVELAEGLELIPFYNEDLDDDSAPAAAVQIREQITAADAIVIFTPEYNGTIPAVIKNVLDWASRPFGAGSISGKPLSVVGTSVGAHAGVWAHDDTRRSAGVAGADIRDDAKLSHRYEYGGNPLEDQELLAGLNDVVVKLVG